MRRDAEAVPTATSSDAGLAARTLDWLRSGLDHAWATGDIAAAHLFALVMDDVRGQAEGRNRPMAGAPPTQEAPPVQQRSCGTRAVARGAASAAL